MLLWIDLHRKSLKSQQHTRTYIENNLINGLQKANVICNFASEYILNNNIQNNSSVSISLQPHALKVVKA